MNLTPFHYQDKQMLLEYLMNPGLTQIGNAGMKMIERMKPGDTEQPLHGTASVAGAIRVSLPSVFFSHPKWDA